MSIEDATRFLEVVEKDERLRESLLELLDESLDTHEVLLEKTNNGLPEPALDDGLDVAHSAHQLIQSKGFSFTRQELYTAAGFEPLSESDRVRLRLIDKSLRSRGLSGVNPVAYTAYSLGINREA